MSRGPEHVGPWPDNPEEAEAMEWLVEAGIGQDSVLKDEWGAYRRIHYFGFAGDGSFCAYCEFCDSSGKPLPRSDTLFPSRVLIIKQRLEDEEMGWEDRGLARNTR